MTHHWRALLLVRMRSKLLWSDSNYICRTM